MDEEEEEEEESLKVYARSYQGPTMSLSALYLVLCGDGAKEDSVLGVDRPQAGRAAGT